MNPPRRKFNLTTWGYASIWLVFLAVPVIILIRGDFPAVHRVVGITIVIAFVLIYSTAFGLLENIPRLRRQLARVAAWALPLIFLALAIIPILGWWSLCFLPFLVAIFAYPLPAAYSVWALLIAVMAALAGLFNADDPALIGMSSGVLISTLLIFSTAQITHRMENQTELQHELAVSGERERIAVDVHDVLGHSLTVINLKAEVAARLLESDAPEDTGRAKAEVDEIRRLSRTALAEVRSTVTQMRAPDLAGELAAAHRALTAAGITAHLPDPTGAIGTTGTNAGLFSWLVREAVTNVVRHSGARTCTVHLEPQKVQVSDDGRGFDTHPGTAYQACVTGWSKPAGN